MTITNIAGYGLIAVPFVGLFLIGSALLGPLLTLGVFAVSGVACGTIYAGVRLTQA